MILQVNDSGSWRNVIRFHAADLPNVEEPAKRLAIIADVRGMRVMDDGIEVFSLNMATLEWEVA